MILDVFDEYDGIPICEYPEDIAKYPKCRVISRNDSIDNAFLDAIVKLKNRVILIEEVDRFCSPSYVDSRLDFVVRYGRHSNLSLLGISRRPAEMHRNLTANALRIHSFRMTEPRDIQYFRQVSADFADRIKALGKYQYETIDL